jgi:DNA-binding SARP family transcriptional activator/Tfp pilus assembly protein PilF
MRFSILGPLRVQREDGALVAMRGGQRRTLLAALLVQRDAVVSMARLSELLWGRDAVLSAATPLYNQVMRLRQALDDDGELIRAVAPGYQIHIRPDQVDASAFTELCAQARRAAVGEDWSRASACYTDALALWRGEILADVPALSDHPAVHQFEEDRLAALHARIEADLHLGRHDELIGELKTLAIAHPLRESVHGQLMLALHRSGRQAEALDAYRVLRRATVDELGVEPGPAIQALQASVLNADPSLAMPGPPPPARVRAPADGRPAPRQLPADSRLFTGRRTELDQLISLTRSGVAPERAAGTVVISAINGMGGVGKTALAVRAAHRLREHYPDGQLFIDLHGYSANLEPVTSGDALDYLLRSLAVPAHTIPGETEARAALLRSKLAETKTLIILDNAANAAQVRPLLPAAPHCLVLITSRNRLTSLDDAHLLALDVLPPNDAEALLREIAGPTRATELDQQPQAVTEIITYCGHMPLAIRILGANLRHRPALTITALADELRNEPTRLDRIRDEERDLTSIFDSSLRVLPDEARHLFRLLGLIPGPDFDAYAAAHLLNTDLPTAQHHLDTLHNHNLLIQHTPTRYRLHDLLRTHATSLISQDNTAPAALDRLLDYYLATAQAAGKLMTTTTRPRSGPDLNFAAPARVFEDASQAMAWFTSERAGLLAAIAAPVIDPVQRGKLIGALAGRLHVDGSRKLAAELHFSAAASAGERGDRIAEANALVDLGRSNGFLGETDRALKHLAHAAEIYRGMGEKRGEANALLAVGRVHLQRGEFKLLIKPCEHALAMYRKLGDRPSEAEALAELGLGTYALGRNAEAIELFERALEIYREYGFNAGEAGCLRSVSMCYFAVGDFDAVQPALDRALSLAEMSMGGINSSTIVQEIARQRSLTGEYDEAERLFNEVLEDHRRTGFRLSEGHVYYELGNIALARGEYGKALELCIKSLDMLAGIDESYGKPIALSQVARVHYAMGNFELAEPLLEQSLRIHRDAQYLPGEAKAINIIAALKADTGGPEAGLDLYRESIALALRAEDPLEQARALEGMARCEAALGMRESAIEHLEAAVDLYRRMRAAELGPSSQYLTALSAQLAGQLADGPGLGAKS